MIRPVELLLVEAKAEAETIFARPLDARLAGFDMAAVRPLPYPFHGYLTITSDCDNPRMEAILNVASILREDYALPISDSFFPKWLFQRGLQRQEHPSGTPRLVFEPHVFLKETFEWLRAFHTGAFDVVHGWIPRMMIQVTPDFILTGPAMKESRSEPALLQDDASTPAATKMLSDIERPEFTIPTDWHKTEPPRYLFFRTRIPVRGDHLSVRLILDDVPVSSFSTALLTDTCSLGFNSYAIDLHETVGTDPRQLRAVRYEFCLIGQYFAHLRDVCLLSDLRRDIVLQKTCLEHYNLRVPVYTSHGGGYDIGRRQSVDLKSSHPMIVAEDSANPHYAIDLLEEYGLVFFNTANNTAISELRHISDLVFPTVLNTGKPVYDFSRFIHYPKDAAGQYDYTPFQRQGEAQNPSLSDFIGFHVNNALRRMEKPGTGALIYTHCLVKTPTNPDFRTNARAALFDEAAHAALRSLQDRYYNLTGTVASTDRVLVAPTSYFLRLSRALRGLNAHCGYDGTSNSVYIVTWTDPVTGRLFPDTRRLTHDLAGLTVYVRDSHTARLFVHDLEVSSLIRNPADETGQESITVADDSVMHPLVGRVPLQDSAGKHVALDGLSFETGDVPPHVLRLDAAAGSLAVPLPGQALSGFHYLGVSFRKLDAGTAIRLEIENDEGLRLAIAERDFSSVDGAAIIKTWREPSTRLVVTPLHFLIQALNPADRRPPRGSLRAIRLFLEGNEGDRFELHSAYLLRDAPGPRSALCLVGGRLHNRSDIERIEMACDGKTSVARLHRAKCYLFDRKVPVSSLVTVRGRTEAGEWVYPLCGGPLEIATDNLCVDF